MKRFAVLAGAGLAVVTCAAAAADKAGEGPSISGSASISHYALPDEPDLDVVVGAVNAGALRLEARHNYEARHATSAFVGWKFAGGENVTYEITPILGGLFGSAHGVVPGVEASFKWRSFDAYVEAEYVHDTSNSQDSFFYTWNELGWSPAEHVRLGLVGQRTRIVHNDRSLQRGLFAQLTFEHGSIAVYAFNPDAGSRYAVLTLALSF